jgi:hypothetical protein
MISDLSHPDIRQKRNVEKYVLEVCWSRYWFSDVQLDADSKVNSSNDPTEQVNCLLLLDDGVSDRAAMNGGGTGW